jgi:manganese/zinc/iron transport system substrate-binding protein
MAVRNLALFCLVCLLSVSTGACRPALQTASNGSPSPLKIVATTGMVSDLVQHVVGEHAQVTTLIEEGIDPHLFRPTASDVGKMMQADILFYSGLGLEGAMQTAFEHAQRRGRTVIAVTDRLPRDLLRFPGEFAGHPDPHLWNAPGLWRQCLPRIAEIMSQFDPSHAEDYARNAAAWNIELQALDDYARQTLATIPESQRFLVTAHDAFGYFSQAYGLQERSVQGITTDSEPGVQDINQLVNFLVEQRIPALFVEATVNPASLKAVMERCQERGWTVRQGGLLFSDSMGSPGTPEGTYVGMIEHNVNTVTRALNGNVPENGFMRPALPRPSAP